MKTLTFRVLNCCSWVIGVSLFLTIQFWTSCLMLTSPWQIPPREQHTVQGLNSLSFRLQEAVPSRSKCRSTPTYALQEELYIHSSHWPGCQCTILHHKHKRTQGTSRSQRLSKWNPFQVRWERKWALLRKFLPRLPFTKQPKPREKRVRTPFVHYFHNVINISALKKFMEQLYHSKCPHRLTLTWVLFFTPCSTSPFWKFNLGI